MADTPSTLNLLGAFELIQNGTPVVLHRPRLHELVALLAVRGAPVSRAQLAYRLWPETTDSQARTNVRSLLFRLKRMWPGLDQAITIDRTHVTWREDASVAVDVQRFDQLRSLSERSGEPAERARLLAEAVECYAGDFLPDCYSDWALEEREQLRSRFANLLETLIDTLMDLRRYDEALDRAKQVRTHDPLQESTYRRLMQVYVALGDRAAALRTYHTCASMLEQELGVEPSTATLQLHAQLLQQEQLGDGPDETPRAIERPKLVGRHAEWQRLRQVWRDVQVGQAHCVLIWGEAGIGKTRLAEEMLDWVRRQGYAWASSRSYAAQGALSYAPITEWLRAPTVRPVLDEVDDLWKVELSRLLPELLAERPDLPPPGPLTETWQQQRFFQSIAHALRTMPGPLLLHLDDMQWSDQETLTLLQFLLHGADSHPLLIVGTVRTEDATDNAELAELVKALRHNEQLDEIVLAPLSRQEATELAAQTAGSAISPEDDAALYAFSEGHPLFVIETVRGGLTGSAHRDSSHLATPQTGDFDGLAEMPPKIFNLLSARLRQLSPVAQQVASTAAVIGRAFTYAVLRAATSLEEVALVDALDELWTRRIIREQGGDRYDFSHDRIREVAYRQISRARCRLLHRQVAEALETLHVDDLEDVAGELAAHYAQAGDSNKAHQYYRQAADVALAQHAYGRAETMIQAALLHIQDDPVAQIHLLSRLNVVLRRSVQLERWARNLDEQQALVDALSPPHLQLDLMVMLSRCEYFLNTNQGEQIVSAALAALNLAESLGDTLAQAHAHLYLGQGALAAESRRRVDGRISPIFGICPTGRQSQYGGTKPRNARANGDIHGGASCGNLRLAVTCVRTCGNRR